MHVSLRLRMESVLNVAKTSATNTPINFNFSLILGAGCTRSTKVSLPHQKSNEQYEAIRACEGERNLEKAKPEPRDHHQSRYTQS